MTTHNDDSPIPQLFGYVAAILFVLTLFGCSSTINPDTGLLDVDGEVVGDGGVVMPVGDGAVEPPRDAGGPVDCELDPFEPDDRAPSATFEERRGEEPGFSRVWRGTWATEGAFDVDRVRVHVDQGLVMVVPDQLFTVTASDAREVQIDITCEHPGATFAGCDGGTLVEPNHCRAIALADTVSVTGLCSTAIGDVGAVIDVVAWQAEDAPCERTIRLELTR